MSSCVKCMCYMFVMYCSARMNGGVSVHNPLPMLATTMRGDVPDASNWSTGDVVHFFNNVGFKEWAEVFREQVWRWFYSIMGRGLPGSGIETGFRVSTL